MYQKAVCFRDLQAQADILAMTDPKQMKMRSKSIVGFDQNKWDQISHAVMKLATKRKYEQNPFLRRKLFETHGTTLVECNPTDQRWGIGLAMDDPRTWDRKSWRGQNLLGVILTEVREQLWSNDKYCLERQKALRKIERDLLLSRRTTM